MGPARPGWGVSVLLFLDSNIVIYLVEKSAVWGGPALARFQQLQDAGEQFAVSELVRMECSVGPLSRGDSALLAEFEAFFHASNVEILPLTCAVCDRAAVIRAAHRIRTPDALNLAAAVEGGCGLFSTQDVALGRFPDVPVEALG
jgi:predicted nucleic acid-binding protein